MALEINHKSNGFNNDHNHYRTNREQKVQETKSTGNNDDDDVDEDEDDDDDGPVDMPDDIQQRT